MITKTCHQCFNAFTAREGAQYCSAKCRAAANYAKNKRRTDISTLVVEKDKSEVFENQSKVGVLEVSPIFAQNLEKDYSALLLQYEVQVKALESTSQRLSALKLSVIALEEKSIPHFQYVLAMAPIDIYNTYLNKKYQDALLADPKYASLELKAPHDYHCGYGMIHSSVQVYIAGVHEKMTQANSGLIQYQQQIADCETEIQRANEELIFTKERLRFLQQRILSFSN